MLVQRVGTRLVQGEDGRHAPGEGELVESLFIRRAGDDRLLRTELGGAAGGEPGLRDGDDGFRTEVARQNAGGITNGTGAVTEVVNRVEGAESVLLERVALRLLDDLGHDADDTRGVIAHGGLARKHDGGGAVEDGVRHVADLRTGRGHRVNHGFEHLGRRDDHLAGAVAGADKALLNPGESLKLDLDPHIAARDHNAVRVREDLLEVLDPLVVLDLGDDADIVPAVVVEETAHRDDVLFAPHERCRHKVDVMLDTEAQIRFVTRAHEGHIQVDIGQVDALVVGDLTADRDAADDVRLIGALDGEDDSAVVDEYPVAGVELVRQIRVGHADLCPVAENIAVRQREEFALRERHFTVAREVTETDLGPLGIQHDSRRHFQAVTHAAEHRDGLCVLFMCAV